MSALGARTVCRLAGAAGHETALLDFPNLPKRPTPVSRPEALAYLNPFILNETGPLSFFTRYKRLGPEPEVCARMIIATEPDILLISCFAYAYAEDALALARAIREVSPDLAIVAGGAGATVLPEKYLYSGDISFVLAGEAETNLLQFLREYEKSDPDYSRVAGLFAYDGAGIVRGDKRRIADEDELDWVHSLVTGRRGGRLNTSLSRGCPKACAFCSNHLCHGRVFRKIPVEKVIAGMETTGANYGGARSAGSRSTDARSAGGTGIDVLNFEDDNLLADPGYTAAVIGHARAKLSAPVLMFENGIDAAYLGNGVLDSLIDSGLGQLNLSLGSIDSEVLAGASRDSTGDRIAELTAHAAARGVGSVTYFICGLPGDNRRTVVNNLLFLASVTSVIGISLFYPTPGIPGFTDTSAFLRIPAFFCCASSAYPWTKTLSTETLITAFRLARLINLVKNPEKATVHDSLIRAILRTRRLHTWQKTGAGMVIVPVPNQDEELAGDVIQGIDVDMSPGHP